MPLAYTEVRVPVEIVCARTEDGVLHSGAFIRPAKSTPQSGAVVLWIHGSARNFYYPSYLCVGQSLAARGIAFLSGNTRGHDVGAVVRWDEERDQAVLGGAAWELFDESALDVAAWIDRLVALGHDRIVLVGHSAGGWKAAHYQATRQDPRVGALVLASTPASPPAPRLRHPPDLLALAARMVKDGHGEFLLPLDRLGHHQSAASFARMNEINLDLYGVGPDGPLLAQVGCPILAWYGTAPDEALLGSLPDLERARSSLAPGAHLDVHRFEGANHMYNGHEEEVAEYLARWLREHVRA